MLSKPLFKHHRLESPQVSAETYNVISHDHIEHVALCVEVRFRLCWRDVSSGATLASVIEPIDPSKGGHFQGLHVTPRALAMNQIGFAEPANCLSEGVIVTVADAAQLRRRFTKQVTGAIF